MKIRNIFLVLFLSLNLASCGVMLDFNTLKSERSTTLHRGVLGGDIILGAVLIAAGAGFFSLVPVVIDFMVGTLYYTPEQLTKKPLNLLETLWD